MSREDDEKELRDILARLERGEKLNQEMLDTFERLRRKLHDSL